MLSSLVEHALVDQLAVLVADVFRDQLPRQRGGRADLEEALEDRPNELGIGLVDDQLAVLDLVAQRRPAAHPHAPLAGCGELVPDALADHLALELGKGQQNVQRQPAHRRGGVEGLRH